MAIIMKDGKEVRAPGRAIHEAQRREGALGKLDSISWRKFQKMPIAERRLMISEARVQKANSIVKVDLAALNKADAVFIFRENSFLNDISAYIKAKAGDKFCTITIPTETETLSQQDFELLNRAFEVIKKIRNDGRRIDDTVRNIYKTQFGELPFFAGRIDAKLFSYDEGHDFYRTEQAQDELKLVVREMAKRTLERGAENLVVILGVIERNDDGGFGTKGGFNLMLSGFNTTKEQRLQTDSIANGFKFVSDATSEVGIKVLPAYVGPSGELLIFRDIKDISFGDNGGIENINQKGITSLDITKQALFADRHVSKDFGQLIFFSKQHESNLVREEGKGEYLPLADVKEKNMISVLGERALKNCRLI